MGALSIWSLLIPAAIIWLIIAILSHRGGHGHATSSLSSYVITHWRVSEGGTSGNLVDIRGRRAGLISYFLHTVGIDPKISILIDRNKVCVQEGSLSGFMRQSVPVTRISAGIHGYSKPWKRAVGLTAILLILILPIADASTAASPLIFLAPVGGWVYYKLHKSLVLAVETTGGGVLGLSFTPSVIEGISVDEQQAAKVIQLIEKLMYASQAPSSPFAGALELSMIDQMPEEPRIIETPAPAPTEHTICEFCPECGQRNDEHLVTCKRCGAAFTH